MRTGAAGSELASDKKGALVIAIMDPCGNDGALAAMAPDGVTAFAARPHHDLPAAADLRRSSSLPCFNHPGKPRNPNEPGLE